MSDILTAGAARMNLERAKLEHDEELKTLRAENKRLQAIIDKAAKDAAVTDADVMLVSNLHES